MNTVLCDEKKKEGHDSQPLKPTGKEGDLSIN